VELRYSIANQTSQLTAKVRCVNYTAGLPTKGRLGEQDKKPMSSTANYKPQTGALPAVLIGNTTAEQIILSASATPLPVLGGTVPTFLPLVVSIPSGSVLEQQEWSGSASGYIAVVAAGASTVTAKLYSGTSATPGSNTLLATSGAVAYAAPSTGPFIISIEKAIYDSVSGKLNGVAEMLINGSLVARAAFSTVVTGINNTNNPVLNLCLSFTFSVANAANKVNVQTFEIDF
jgi:hypothetical protein